MKTAARLIVIASILTSSLSLTGCKDEVTQEQAAKAAEILRRWQLQNR